MVSHKASRSAVIPATTCSDVTQISLAPSLLVVLSHTVHLLVKRC